MKKDYTIKELSEKLSVSYRTIERYLRSLLKKENNKVLIPSDIAELLESRHKSDKKTDTSPTEEYDVIEAFTSEEYQEFQKRLIEYPMLKKDLEYHKESVRSHERQMELILRTIEQKNYIEAKEKKLDQ
jgi:DNA-binding transcriptional MerR regulator